jgi:beta-aspartyl-peptidase (threonine type)
VKLFRICIYHACLLLPVLIVACISQTVQQPSYAIAIHGGAGTISRDKMTPESEASYREALEIALRTGDSILAHGGTAVDAVEATIITMEDSPLFNAGKGAVFTNAGTNELDASIMNGADLQAGAVAAIRGVKNPIVLARAVMDYSPHVLLIGLGAEEFARERGMEPVGDDYFHTERRWQALEAARRREREEGQGGGTVGVVALDRYGDLAAGTSTGGRTNKRWGRVGDSPVIGAGTFADNRTCAVSATGHGEYFMRAVIAHDIAALMGYEEMTVQQAADAVIQEKLTAMGGTGGVVAMDAVGNVAFSFNTAGMYRGYLTPGGTPVVAMYGDDE